MKPVEVTSASSFRVLIVGSQTIDRIEIAGQAVSKPGGVPTYAGLTFLEHGIHVRVVCNLAKEEHWIARRLEGWGMDVRAGESTWTTGFVNCVSGEVRTQRMPRAAEPIEHHQVSRAIDGVNLVHLGPLHPHDLSPSVLASLPAGPACISLDLQGYVRHVDHGEVCRHVSPSLPRALQIASFAKASEEEMSLVEDALGLRENEVQARFGIKELIVTAGARGGRVITAEGSVPFLPVAVDRVVDPTGAGDVFFAAYLSARLQGGADIEGACKHSSAVAARHVKGEYLSALGPASGPCGC